MQTVIDRATDIVIPLAGLIIVLLRVKVKKEQKINAQLTDRLRGIAIIVPAIEKGCYLIQRYVDGKYVAQLDFTEKAIDAMSFSSAEHAVMVAINMGFFDVHSHVKCALKNIFEERKKDEDTVV